MNQELRDEIERMIVGLQEAIADGESAEETTYGGFDGRLLSKAGTSHTYQFTLRSYWDIDENAKIAIVDVVSAQERKLKVDGRVLSREANKIMIVTRMPLPAEHLSQVLFIEDKTWLLKRQLQALENFAETWAAFGAKTLGLESVQSSTKAVRGKLGNFTPHPHQERAIAHGLGSEKTLIVGPPGTGKTTTLSDLICRYLRQGLSVLLVSHTNIATDNAFIRLIQAMLESKKADLQTIVENGLAVRAGDPRHASLRTGTYRGLTVNALAEARMGKQAETRDRLEQSLPALDRRIEELEHSAHAQEQAWLPQRDELEKKMAPLEKEVARLQAKVAEQERRDQEFLAKKAKERQAAEKILEPFLKRQKDLEEARSWWVAEVARRKQAWEDAEQEVAQVRAMGRISRFLSEHRNYDFEAADLKVASLLTEKEQGDTTLGEIDDQLSENRMAQLDPETDLYHIDFAVQGFHNAKRTSGNTDLQRIELFKKDLAPLFQEMQSGEQQVRDAYAQKTHLTEERDRIKAQIEDLKAQQDSFKRQIVADAQLVSTTITSVYINLDLLEREFDVVVVDELSMISIIGVLLVASRATKHFVGAGDPNQLSPVVKLENERKAPHAKEWLGKDLFTYLGVGILTAIHGEKECCLLTEQGRSSPTIIAPINHYIYQGILTSREETANPPSINPLPEKQLLLVDTSGTEAECVKPSKTRPRENEYHARLDVILARQALESLPPHSSFEDPTVPRVVVIAPYRSQVQLVQKKLREAKIAQLVHVGTINTVQSLEFPVVIFDTVEAPGMRPWEFTFDRTFDDRQMATEATRKLNVGWTRARYKLIIVAHRQHLHNHLPHHMEEDPVRKQRLLVDLVDWAYREGHVNASNFLGLISK